MKERILSRKLLLSLLLLLIGTGIEFYKPLGLSANFLTFLLGMGASYKLFNVTSEGIKAYQDKPKISVDEIKTLLLNADRVLSEVNQGQQALLNNAQNANQALASLLTRSTSNGPTTNSPR